MFQWIANLLVLFFVTIQWLYLHVWPIFWFSLHNWPISWLYLHTWPIFCLQGSIVFNFVKLILLSKTWCSISWLYKNTRDVVQDESSRVKMLLVLEEIWNPIGNFEISSFYTRTVIKFWLLTFKLEKPYIQI